MKIVNFYLHGEKINFDGNIHKTRKRYTEKTKLEIREHYMLTQNYAATAKKFGVNESTVRTIVKTSTRNGKLNDKGNHSRAGRPLTYPLEVEKDILSWLLELRCSSIYTDFARKGKACCTPSQPYIQRKSWLG